MCHVHYLDLRGTHFCGQLFVFQEKPTQDKLDILYRKSLYVMALSLAKTQGLDKATVADIHKQYGDHLYVKGDYDGAMQQYVQTIGQVQASYVIRKVSVGAFPNHIMNVPHIVFGLATDQQSRDVPAGTALYGIGKRRPHNAPSQHVHEAQGSLQARQLYQA